MKLIILACLVACAAAGVVNHAVAPVAYSAAIPSAVSYSNVYNAAPLLRSAAAPIYPSVAPLAYNTPLAYNAYNPINAYSAYNSVNPLAYNAVPAVAPYGVSPYYRSPYVRSLPYLY